jgi:urease beta subunit
MMKRQGDLLILKINKIPENAAKRASRVLAEGEATGHLHELDSGDVYEIGETLYFRVESGKTATLNHPEHAAVTFDPGEYKLVRQREYVPNEWKARIVRD